MTNAELAILSLIAEQPRHGYDIEQVIERRGMRDWTEIGFSSIYYLLNKLEKGGMIESQLQQSEGKGPTRKVYNITEQGRQTQIEETIIALSIPKTVSSSFLLGLSNFPLLSQEQVLEALDSYVRQVEERLEQMFENAGKQRPVPSHVDAMFDYSQAMVETELDWIRDFIKKVGSEND